MNKSNNRWQILCLAALLCLGTAVSRPAQATNAAVPEKELKATPVSNPGTDVSGSDSLASDAGKDFSHGGKSIGSGFVKGAKVTGHAFKKAGNTMAKGFKKAGSAIHDYFAGKKQPEVQESDLSGVSAEGAPVAASQRDSASGELDAVGNDLPKKSEPKELVKKGPAPNSKLD